MGSTLGPRRKEGFWVFVVVVFLGGNKKKESKEEDKTEGHADKEARQFGEQAGKGFTFHDATVHVLSMSLPADSWLICVCLHTHTYTHSHIYIQYMYYINM